MGGDLERSRPFSQGMCAIIMHCYVVIAAHDGRLGRIRRDNILCPNDFIDQAEPTLLACARLCPIQEESTGHPSPGCRSDHLLYHIFDPENPNMLADLCLLAPRNG